jgi:hypothetical protein
VNDWLGYLAEIWGGGQEDRCTFGHDGHATKTVTDALIGPIEVFDWEQYATDQPGFCPARDSVSQAVDQNGEWEQVGREIMRRFIETPDPGVVLDFGAHIGTFTLYAAQMGRGVLAVDASPEHLMLLNRNASTLGVEDRVTPCRGWIGPDAPACTPDGTRVRFLKSDLEGAEDEMVRVTWPLWQNRLIDAALLEVSPIFADYYPTLIGDLMDCDYRAGIAWLMNQPEVLTPLNRNRLAEQLTAPQCDVLLTLEDV